MATNNSVNQTITGNAGTATALQNARTIGGVSFNGTANTTVATATGGFTVSGGDLAIGANNLTITGSIGATAARVTKGWFTDLEVTNGIVGSITGNAATITVADETTDTTCFLGFYTAATGSLAGKTNTNLTFNANTGVATFGQTIVGSISGNAATVTAADEATDTTCFISFFTAATGSLGNKTNSNMTFNSNTGVATFASTVLTTTDINGGTVDGTSIGASSASTIIGTTIQANTSFLPDADGGAALGSATLGFSILGLSSGSTINFANSNVVITHSSGILTMGTGEMRITSAGTDATSVLTQGSTNTLANKTITASTNVLGGVTMTLGSDADGDTYYRASNVLTRLAKGTAGQMLIMNSGATAPSWSANNVSRVLTAYENLTAGQPVGLSNHIASSVARATRTVSAVDNGITTPLFTGKRNSNYCPIGGDKFVMLNYTAATSDTIFAQVGSINTSTQTMTLGSALAVATAFTPVNTTLQNACVCKLDTDKFIVFYLLDASTTIIKYRIGTVSGTTITFGTEATAITAGTTVATSVAFNADFLSTDKGVFSFKAATTTDSKVTVFTVSGTVATFSAAAVTPGANSQTNVISYIKKIATDKFVLVSAVGANSIYGQVFTCSGTVITAGTEAQISSATSGASSAANDQGFTVCSPATDVFVWGANSGTTTTKLVGACTVSTRTITAGTPITKVGATGFASGALWATSASNIYIGAVASSQIWNFTLSGSTLTDVSIVAQAYTSASNGGAVIYMDNSYPITLDTNSTVFFNIQYIIACMSNNWVGFIQSSPSKSSTGTVVLTGSVDANQTALIPGAQYQAVAGALSFVASNAALTTLDGINVVTALSTTEVVS